MEYCCLAPTPVFSLQFLDSWFPVLRDPVPGKASSVVGLEKHEKFKQGDSADNEDELCFVCYKNCKWQAIHHSFGFRADSDWMPFWLADWLTDWLNVGCAHWLANEEAELVDEHAALLFCRSQSNFMARNFKQGEGFGNLMHLKLTLARTQWESRWTSQVCTVVKEGK